LTKLKRFESGSHTLFCCPHFGLSSTLFRSADSCKVLHIYSVLYYRIANLIFPYLSLFDFRINKFLYKAIGVIPSCIQRDGKAARRFSRWRIFNTPSTEPLMPTQLEFECNLVLIPLLPLIYNKAKINYQT